MSGDCDSCGNHTLECLCKGQLSGWESEYVSLQLTQLELAYLLIAINELSSQTDLRQMEHLENKISFALRNLGK